MLVITRGYSEIVEVIGWFFRFELTSELAVADVEHPNNQRTNYPGLPWSSQRSILHRTSNRMWDPLWFGIVNSGNIIETTLVILEADRSSTLFLYAKSQLHLVPTYLYIYIVCIAFFLVAADIVGSFLGMYIYQQLNICVCYIHVDHVCIYRLFCDNR